MSEERGIEGVRERINPCTLIGTDTGGISPRCWEELLKVTTPTLSTEYDSCRLGLQLLQESLQHLSNFYTQKRFYTKVCEL